MPPDGRSEPRGALLVLVQASASMGRAIPVRQGASGLTLAMEFVTQMLRRLRDQQTDSAFDPVAWDVAVMAVRAGGEGAVLESLLEQTSLEAPFLPLSALCELPDPCVHPPTALGVPPHQALVHAGKVVQAWTLEHDHPVASVVVFCADEQAVGASFRLYCESLRILTNADWPLLQIGCLFTPEAPEPVAFPVVETQLPPGGAIREMWKCAYPIRKAPIEKRALSINDIPAGAIVRLLGKLGSGVAPRGTGGNASVHGSPIVARVLWTPREGNTDEEYEDACDLDRKSGLAVVADGAGQGIFSRRWAILLTQRYQEERPNLDDPDAVGEWLQQRRREWLAGIDYPNLHGLAQQKINRIGGAATFLAFQFSRSEGRLRWRVHALGDTCFFWLRDGKLQAAFPLVRSEDFDLAPDLVCTLRQVSPRVRFVTAEGSGKVGDLYVLATDAVAKFLLRCYEQNTPPDWNRLWKMDIPAWRQEVQSLRDQERIVNDDSTLVMLRPEG